MNKLGRFDNYFVSFFLCARKSFKDYHVLKKFTISFDNYFFLCQKAVDNRL